MPRLTASRQPLAAIKILMSRRRKEKGKCKICGFEGPLSFEHVPPRAAFNDMKYYYTASIMDILKKNPDDFDTLSFKNREKATKQQGSIGFYSLCTNCNNNTGSWYGKSFVDWICQSIAILSKTRGNPTIYYPTYIYPLRIIKQIVTMFFSIEHERFGEVNPYLVKFVLNKEEKYLPTKYRFFCYYNIEGSNRYIGGNILGDLNSGSSILISEITFPPMGLVMTIDSDSPNEKLTEITHFSKYGFNEWTDHFQKFAILPTYLPYYAGDYRTKDEIIRDIYKSKNGKDGG